MGAYGAPVLNRHQSAPGGETLHFRMGVASNKAGEGTDQASATSNHISEWARRAGTLSVPALLAQKNVYAGTYR